MSDLKRLITKIRQGSVILWAGAGFSRYTGIPMGLELVEQLINATKPSEQEDLRNAGSNLPEVAERFVDIHHGARSELLRVLGRAININPKSIEVHRLLTDIVQIRTIVTTNYDNLFELAYGNDIVTLTQDEHVPTYAIDDRVKLYKIHGDFSSPAKMILTKSDYELFYCNHLDESPLWNQIKSMLATSTILFVGYSMDDSNFSSVFKRIRKYLGDYQNEHFFVAPNIPGFQINKLANQGIAAINLTAEELILQIHSEVKRHILEDAKQGRIQPNLAQKFAKKFGLNVTYELPPDGHPIIRGLGTSGSGEPPLQLTVTLPVDISLEPLKTGDIHEVTLPKGSIFNLETNFNGIFIPTMDDARDVSLHIKRIPNYSYPAKLILSDSNLVLQAVQVDAYQDLDRYTVEIQHNYFRLILTINPDTGRSNMSLSFLKCSDAYGGKLVTQFVSTWFDGDTLRLVNESSGEVAVLGKIPIKNTEGASTFVKRVQAIQKFYEQIILIQNCFNVYFDLPEKPNEDEQAAFEQLLSIATNKVEHCTSITFNMHDESSIRNILNLEGQSLQFKGNLNSVRIFEKEIQPGVMCTDIANLIIMNHDQVQEKLTAGIDKIAVVVSSQSGEIVVRYER